MSSQPGIYVEILIQDTLDRVWQLTQDPALHRRWDLRFTDIDYLPLPDPTQPQRFLYATRIGFGLAIRGTGESVATRTSDTGDTSSSLKFFSEDPKSLIREGAGYWKYVPTPQGVRFFTWYDYTTRFGPAGRLLDTLFRPLMGWATAWSFDRMRLWAEEGQTPEASMAFTLIHATARIAIASIWIWHGLVPKLLFHHPDEQLMLTQAGVSLRVLPWFGIAEILLGLLTLVTWRWRAIFPATAALMLVALAGVAVASPAYLKAAFNPVTLNGAVIALALVGYLSSATLPTARRCLRRAPEGGR